MTDCVTIITETSAQTHTKLTAELGRHIRTDPNTLAKYAYKRLGVSAEDIATIAEAVALADRLSPRRRSAGWSRSMILEIPVLDLAVFQQADNQELLLDALNFLTGDDWKIGFVQRDSRPLTDEYLPLVSTPPKFVVPYSNGLDSFAQARLLEAVHGRLNVLRVRAGTVEQTDSRIEVPVLRVRRGFHMGRVREQTYRSRPFVFYSFAAIAAVTAEAEAVVIGESGQGSIGPSFAIYADEWPLRSSHPGFLWRLQRFLSAVLQEPVEFRQPQLWRTKGQVLEELRTRHLESGWEKTKSCSLRPRERRKRQSCGFCGGCILRRVSAHAAGLPDESDYAFDVRSPELQLTAAGGERVPMQLNDRQILARSTGSMAVLADTLSQPNCDAIIAREIDDLPDGLRSHAGARMRAWLHQHSREWGSFLSALPQSAWLRHRFKRA